MKIISVLLIIVIAALIALYEWPRINEGQKKEKRVFGALMLGAVTLAILVVYFPEMPGPTELVQLIFKPFGGLIGK